MRKASFGENRNEHFDQLLFFLRSRHILKHLKHLKGPLKALDLGCGYNPALLEKIINYNNFSELIGIDLSVNQKYSNKKIKLISSNLEEKLPLKPDYFDVVFSTAVLEHLDNYNLSLKEIYRVLKPGGYLYLSTPDPLSKPILEFIAFKLKIIDPAEIIDHKRYFTRKNLKKELTKTGFRNITIKKLQFGLNNLYICQK
jgi:ubiquinone/menaquinone biosynthesis C-methylase UbiE